MIGVTLMEMSRLIMMAGTEKMLIVVWLDAFEGDENSYWNIE